jgi:hypothetical protein
MLGRRVADNFLGWHHSSHGAFKQTTHAIAALKHAQAIETFFFDVSDSDPMCNGQARGYSMWHSDPKVYRALTLIQSLAMSDRYQSMTQASLIVFGVVTVKGPGQLSLCTRCVCRDILVKTAQFRSIESELWSLIDNTMHDKDDPDRVLEAGCLAVKLRRPRGSTKRRRVQIDRTFDWLCENVGNPLIEALVRCMCEVNVMARVRSDAGEKYRHWNSVFAGRSEIANLVDQIVFST